MNRRENVGKCCNSNELDALSTMRPYEWFITWGGMSDFTVKSIHGGGKLNSDHMSIIKQRSRHHAIT